jgi:Tol biopolymer transport system component/DNA-binding winged helix-turn-helix (wHTH) protein
MRADRRTSALRLGEFRFDPVLNELSRAGVVQRLPVRLADLLLRLAVQPGQLVRRETLLDEVWERRHVNEEVLSRAIADLRQALGDDAKAPRYIETLPKLGYRLVCDVAEAGDAIAAPVLCAASAETSVPVTSVATAATAATPARIPRNRRTIVTFLIALLLVAIVSTVWFAQKPESPPQSLTAQRLLQARPFTSDPGRELLPRFTPDGRWVVYTRFQPETEPAHLRLRAIDGTEDRVLVQDVFENYCGSVSPDGAQLTWLRTRDGRCEVMYRALLGGASRVLAGCAAAVGCPEWTPDGGGLLLEGDEARAGLREVSFPDGASRTLTKPVGGMVDVMPRISRDGADIVFWRADGNARTLMRVARAGGEATQASDGGYLAFGHAFDVDGALIAADDRFGQRALVRVVAGKDAELLGAAGARHPDISPDGALVYEVAQYDANLWRIDLRDAAQPPQQLTRNARYDSQPALSPDAAWLAFGSNRDGREGVYLMRADGSDERKLPLDPEFRWTSPAWSPDGASLLVLRYVDNQSSVCRHVIASAATDCPPALGRNRNGAFFLAPEQFAAVDDASDTAGLWQHGFDVQAPARVDTGGPVDRCRATPRWLACHRPGQAGLWLRDRQSGESRDVLPELHRDLRAWDLVGDAVYFPRGGEARGLYRHDLLDGSTRRVHELVPSAIGDAVSVAPDESFAVVARTDALDVDLMLLPAR